MITYDPIGLRNNDNITATFSSLADHGTGVGEYPIVPSLQDTQGKLENYTITSKDGSLRIDPAPLIGQIANASRAYGQGNPTFSVSYTGFANGETAILLGETFVGATTAAIDSPIGEYAIVVASSQSAANYDIGYLSGTLTVTPYALAVTANSETREYGLANPEFSGTLLGVVNGDGITASYTTTATGGTSVGTYAIKPQLSDPNSKLGNYAVTSTDGVLTITKASLNVSAHNATRPYGASNSEFSGTIAGLRNGDNIIASYSSTVTAASVVGSYPIVASLADPDGKLSNYDLTLTDGTLAIGPAPLIGHVQNANRAYGQPNPLFTVTYTGFVNDETEAILVGTFVGTTDATESSEVGIYPIHGGGQSAANYTVSYEDGNLTITSYALTVSANSATREYGMENPFLSGILVGNEPADGITASYITVATPGSPVGSYLVLPVLHDPFQKLSQYSVTILPGTLTVSKAPLIVTASDKMRSYGAPNPELTGRIVMVRNGDDITATYASSANMTTGVGEFPIVPSLSDPESKLANYDVTSMNGTLTESPASLVGRVANATRLYGETNPAFAVTYEGFVNGEDEGVLHGTFTATTTATATTGVGTYAIRGSGQSADNYSLSFEDGILTIDPQELLVTASDATREYGLDNPEFSGTITGVQGSDGITATFGSAATRSSSVGTHPVTAVLHDPDGKLGNYTLRNTAGTLTISKASLTVAAGSTTRLYGGSNPEFGGTISGLRNLDNITAAYATTANAFSGVGSYSIVPGLSDPDGRTSNYTVAVLDGTLTIDPAPLLGKVQNATRAYGQPNPLFTVQYDGFVNGENEGVLAGTFVGLTTATENSPLGSYPIQGSGQTAANYAIDYLDGTLTITAYALTVTANDATREYGLATPELTGTLVGALPGDGITASYSTAATIQSPVGTYSIAPALDDPNSKLGNYSVTIIPGALQVTRAALTVAAGNAERLYGASNPIFTGTVTGVRNGDNITASYSSTATVSSAVGVYPIEPSLTDPDQKLGNYNVTSSNGTLTIGGASLIGQVQSAMRLYGAVNPAFTVVYSGFVNGETASVLSGAFIGTSPATQGSAVGTYPIQGSGQTALNYIVSYIDGSLTVTKAPLTLSADSATRTYGAVNPLFTGTLSGVQNDDNIAASYTTAAVQSSPVGTYAITPLLADPQGKLGNYSLTSTDGVLTITPAALTGTADNQSRAVGEPNPAFTVTYSGFVNGQNASIVTGTFVAATTANFESPAGTYPIDIIAGQTAPNYDIAYLSGTLTVTNASPSITSQPVSRTVAPGVTVVFSVTAAGTHPLNYQWRSNGVSIANATLSALTLNNVQTSDAGNYDVVVSNLAGSVTSSIATLTVTIPPAIVTQPQSQNVIAGSAVSFSVVASGTAPFNYQWKFNDSNIPGATGSSYNIPNAQSANAGSYSVAVCNSTGTNNSATATLTVNVTLSATATTGGSVSRTPDQTSYAPGTAVTLTAIPQAGYQFTGWSGDASGTISPLNITLTTNKVITANFSVSQIIVDNPAAVFTGTWTTDTAPANKFGADYRYAASSSGSATATATYTPAIVVGGRYDVHVWFPTISKPAAAVPILITTNGGSQTFTLNQTTGAGAWQVVASGLRFAAGTSGSIGISNNVGQNAKNVAADAVRLVYSSVQDAIAPSIVTQPVSQSVNAGGSVNFSVSATGTAPLSYQWRFNGANVSGATSSTLAVNNVQVSNVGNYDVVVTNAAGSVTSATATLSLNGPPVIITQPVSQTVVQGASVTFDVTATGSAPLSYQWQLNGVNIGGATSSTLTLNNVQAANAGNYTVVVANSLGNVTSSIATLTVNVPAPAVVLTSPPGSAVFSAPASINLAASVTTNGNTINKVQFYHTGTIFIGEDSTAPYSFTWPNVVQGGYTVFARLVYNGSSTLDSTPVSIIVAGPPPSPWTTADIGTVSVAGTALHHNGTYYVAGAGNISAKADNFRFVYQQLSSDGEIRARIPVVGSSGTSQRIGIMTRETLTAGSRTAFIGVGSGGSFFALNRSTTGGNMSSTSSGTGTFPNVWVRLVRTGNTVVASKSIDGNSWTQVTSQSISMAQNIFIGLAVASGSSTVLNSSQFDNVTVVP